MMAGGTAVQPATAQEASATSQAGAVATAAETGEAPSEALAKAAAKRSGRAVEVTGLRHERREVFANADGSFTAREYTQPVRARRGNGWVPVDATLVANGDGTWSPKASTVDLDFSDGGKGPFVRMSRVGREYALTWPGGTLPKPKVEGDTARYEEVLPGVDLAVRAGVEGFSHYFVVKTAEAAGNSQLDTLELDLSTKGLTVTETSDGAVKAVDSAVGGTVFESGPAAMWDSAAAMAASAATSTKSARPALDAADGGRKAKVALDVRKGKLTLKPDLKLLRGKNTGYPVVIDPTPRTTGTTAWTSVMSGMPTEQDFKYAGDAGVGRCPSDQTPASCSGIGVRRLLFTFPLGYFKGKQILSSTFSARLTQNYAFDNHAEPIDLYRIGSANYTVTSGSNWSNTSDDWVANLMTVDRSITPTQCGSQANLHFSNGQLLTQTQAAVAGGWSTMSLGLRAKDEGAYAGWKRICGNAYLSITYNTPPLQVANATMSSDPGGKCVTDPAKAPYVDGFPMLRGQASDPDHTKSSSDPVKMQYQVFYRDAGNVERSYLAETGYKSPNPGVLYTHRVAPPAVSGVGLYSAEHNRVYQRSTPSAGPDTAVIPFDIGGIPEYGTPAKRVLVGDWNGDGIDTLGVYDPANRTFALRNDNAGPVAITIAFGNTGDEPVVGDWNGDGKDTVGLWRPGNHTFYLNNEHTNNVADIQFIYGGDGMSPLVGDWNGDGVDTIGMYAYDAVTFYIRNANSAGGNSWEIRYGNVGDSPVVGDWNGDKTDSIGVWRSSNHTFYLNNEHANNVADNVFMYGDRYGTSVTPLTGTWVPSVPANSVISWQARAFDGDAWGPWSSASGAGRCYVRRDTTTPAAPIVTADPYKTDNEWRDGVGRQGTFTFDAFDSDVIGYRYTFDDETTRTVATTTGNPVTLPWTPTWPGRHTVDVEAYDAAGKTSAVASYTFLVASGRVAQWNLGDPVGSTEAHDEMGNYAIRPGAGVTFEVPGQGGKADPVARLDGTSEAYLTTADPEAPWEDASVVDTRSSFSVSAWVKPAALDRDMAVVSQDGTTWAEFLLGYDAAAKSWSFATSDDGRRTTVTVPTGDTALNKWVHLTGVFDARATGGPQLRLYVDDGDPATPTGTATVARGAPASWNANGALQIGRMTVPGLHVAHFAGDLSAVRIYNRPVTTAEIAEFQAVRPARKAYWDFEKANADGTLPNIQSMGSSLGLFESTLYRRTSVREPVALSGAGHAVLDGVNDYAYTNAPVVGGDKSFTLSARVRLTNVNSTASQTVLSLPGQNTDRVAVRYDGATQRWKLVLTESDSAAAKVTEVTDSAALPSADGAGSHLAVVYDAAARELRLYVDGGEPVTATVENGSGWASVGGLQVGRSVKTGEYLSGAVDEVRAYAGALSPTVISMIENQMPDPNL
ncbi:LamG-like jellyroll fold domain-containing protein [Streptomyces sp. NPDC127092]|uniref:LamG-like jellyroll fold domain-containing protein n=1 Tax=Streptomyces sp. NPDC127092 TaxID=3347135 RepID=UPI003648FB3B